MMREAAFLAVLALAACDNPCQTLCTHMATYAAECGTEWSEDDILTCEDDQADATADDRQACAEFGNPEVLRRQWDCEDVNLYR